MNNLLRAVYFDIQQKVYLAHLRALGIVGQIITSPFWRLVEGTKSILDLNEHLQHMLDQLKLWASDATTLMEGKVLFEQVEVRRDKIYEDLFKNSEDAEMETYTQVALEMVVTGLVLILERQARDQLSGGQFASPYEQVKKSARNVPCTNTVSERDFAILDVLLRIKPAASCHTLEIYLLWLNNKPSTWLENMNEKERNDLLDMARKNYPKIREQYFLRKDHLKKQHIEDASMRQ